MSKQIQLLRHFIKLLHKTRRLIENYITDNIIIDLKLLYYIKKYIKSYDVYLYNQPV